MILAARPSDGRLLPGLSLAAFAHDRYPDASLLLEAKHATQHLEVRRFVRDGPSDERQVGGVLDIPVSGWIPAGDDAPAIGLVKDDETAILLVNMPHDQEIARATVPFERVLEASPTQASNWFSGRTVILAASTTGSGEIAEHPSGRRIAKAYAHAAAIEALHRRVSPTLQSAPATRIAAGFIAAIGAGIVILGPRAPRVRALIIAGIGLGIVGLALLLAMAGELIAPSVFVAALLAGTAIGAMLQIVAGRSAGATV